VLHDGEIPIDTQLVRGLISEQFPQWVHLSLTRIQSSGTVHAIYRLGDDLAIRLPRHPMFTSALDREIEILPILGPLLDIPTPELVGVGTSTDAYPSSWSVVRWIEGETMAAAPATDAVAVAEALGEFVVSMRSLTIPGPISANQRGRHLSDADTQTRAEIETIHEHDTVHLTALWEEALRVPPWDGVKTWIHADLLPGNLLVDSHGLVAVIDFGECSIGNPETDLIAAWWVFDADARAMFRTASQADDDMWNRARGRALSGAVGAIAYYRDTNPAFAATAMRALRNVVTDSS